MSGIGRTTRRVAAASPLSSPVPSHPLGEDLDSYVNAADKKHSRNGSSSSSRASSSASSALFVLLLLLVAGCGLYLRFGRQQQAAPSEVQAPAARRSTLEQQQGADPVLPDKPMTREEEAIFEQAAEEHYGLPPGFKPQPFSLEDEVQHHTAEDEEGGEVGPDPDHGGGHEVLSEFADSWGEAPHEEAAEAAAQAFDPEVHRAYLELPEWPEADDSELKGSWNFTGKVYDYAAHLPMAKVLSWDNPRLVLFPSFLSPDEVRHMIQVSKDNLERSEVVVAEGDETKSDIRTSFGFWPDSDAVTDAITERIHRVIGVPHDFGEGLYVLNYQINQKYEAHNDHCMDWPDNFVAEPACLDFLKRAGGPECGPGKGGPTCGDRVATFIVYLKSPTKGGQTAFPEASITKQAMGDEHRPGNSPDEWYCSDDRVLSAAPPAGTALLFWDYQPGTGEGTGSFQDGSAKPSAQTVYAAMHSGCPVVEGEKYIATRWIRAASFH